MQVRFTDIIDKIKNNSINLIDIRDEMSFSKGHIINAKNIPYNILISEPERYLKKKETYYIYCQSGVTSNRIVHILNSRGYHTYSIIGGFREYLLWK